MDDIFPRDYVIFSFRSIEILIDESSNIRNEEIEMKSRGRISVFPIGGEDRTCGEDEEQELEG